MDTRTSWVVGVIVVLAVLAGAWLLFGQPAEAPNQQVNVNTNNTTQTATSSGSQAATSTGTGTSVGAGGSVSVGTPATVRLTASGFVPSSVTIKKGQSVTWTNETSGPMWVATAQHPSHTVYSGTSLQQHCPDTDKNDFDQCADGTTYTFTFDKTGTWRYHNHSNASQFGSVIVTD
jgi:plastocyanin